MLLAVTRPPQPRRSSGGDALPSAAASASSSATPPPPDDEDDVLRLDEAAADSHDAHNRPRLRRRLIVSSLRTRHGDVTAVEHPAGPEDDLAPYRAIHTDGLVDFLSSAWKRWIELGEEGRDGDCSLPLSSELGATEEDGNDASASSSSSVPALIPCHSPLHRDPAQRPGGSVMGAVGYYCTDQCTPIVPSLVEELRWDGAVVRLAVERALAGVKAGGGGGDGDANGEDGDGSEDRRGGIRAASAITTHPGHHAARDSFGGYCYVNQAARAAKMMQQSLGSGGGGGGNGDGGDDVPPAAKVAILDVDYHCGNGTASIFYADASVWVSSIHCDPDVEYPFNSGFRDQIGVGEGWGSTMHVPLPPGTTWEGGYRDALDGCLRAIVGFKARGLVVSLGLDTYAGDEVAVRRAGFLLSGDDYSKMGELIGSRIPRDVPTVFIQEGGYKMDVVGDAAADVVAGFVRSGV